MEILSGLNALSVSRLKKTIQVCIPYEYNIVFIKIKYYFRV